MKHMKIEIGTLASSHAGASHAAEFNVAELEKHEAKHKAAVKC
jgi:hypothetical protein